VIVGAVGGGGGSADTSMLSALVFARPSAPVTCTVKFAVPAVVGVPLI
jgi:hypothetical protein